MAAWWKVLLPCAATIAAVSAQSFSYEYELDLIIPTDSPTTSPVPTTDKFVGTLKLYDSTGDGWDAAVLALTETYFGVAVMIDGDPTQTLEATDGTMVELDIELDPGVCYSLELSDMVSGWEIAWEIIDGDGNRVLSAGLAADGGSGGPGPGRRLQPAGDDDDSVTITGLGDGASHSTSFGIRPGTLIFDQASAVRFVRERGASACAGL